MLPDTSNLKELSNAIRKGRMRKGLSREKLAIKLGAPVSRVIDWESYGQKNFQVPNTTMRRALNRVLFESDLIAPKPKTGFEKFMIQVKGWFSK